MSFPPTLALVSAQAETPGLLSQLWEMGARLHPCFAPAALVLVGLGAWIELWICLNRREDWIAAERFTLKAAAWLAVLAVATGFGFALKEADPRVVHLYRIAGWISAAGILLCAFRVPRWPESERGSFRWILTLTVMAGLFAMQMALYLVFGPELFVF